MVYTLDDILDFSFLSIAFILSVFIGKIQDMLCFITFDVVSDILSVAIQILVLWGLVYKLKKIKNKDV